MTAAPSSNGCNGVRPKRGVANRRFERCPVAWLFAVALVCAGDRAAGADMEAQRKEVFALGGLTRAPATYPVEGLAAENGRRPLFFDGPAYRGRPTRVFAWYGVPERHDGKMPAVVLVHGGGGTAFKEWVRRWNAHGFAALAMALEGQNDQREADQKTWRRHAWSGPARDGIYGDSGQPLADQWIYHAVADVVLAHSLLRSFPEVDEKHIGLVGISWGAVVAATVAGIDSRFTFAIPIYGCGGLDRVENQYARALKGNRLYREVWEPNLLLPRARMPMLWLTWLGDQHFPLEAQQASYRAARGARMVAVLPDMRHGHQAGWAPEESYAFAKAVVQTGKPWLREVKQGRAAGRAFVDWRSDRKADRAVLLSTTDAGFTGNRRWTQTAVNLEQKDNRVRASATLPEGTRAYFFNVHCGALTASSEWMEMSK